MNFRNANIPGEILFEFRIVGDYMRVAAVDAASGTEAIVIGPANAARVDMQQLAVQKLNRLLEKSR